MLSLLVYRPDPPCKPKKKKELNYIEQSNDMYELLSSKKNIFFYFPIPMNKTQINVSRPPNSTTNITDVSTEAEKDSIPAGGNYSFDIFS
jgi:hypothetical protein